MWYCERLSTIKPWHVKTRQNIVEGQVNVYSRILAPGDGDEIWLKKRKYLNALHLTSSNFNTFAGSTEIILNNVKGKITLWKPLCLQLMGLDSSLGLSLGRWDKMGGRKRLQNYWHRLWKCSEESNLIGGSGTAVAGWAYCCSPQKPDPSATLLKLSMSEGGAWG